MNDNKLKAYLSIIIYILIYFIGGSLISLIIGNIIKSINDIQASEVFEVTGIFYYLNLVISNFVTYLILFISLFAINFKKLVQRLNKKQAIKILLLGLIGGLVVFFLTYLINYLLNLANIGSSDNQNTILEMLDESKILTFIPVVILAPFVEELVYRESIFELLKEKGIWLSYLVSIIFFALPHMLSTPFKDISWLLMLIPYLLAAFSLTFIYHKSDNIWGSVIAHIVNNLLAFLGSILVMGVILC